MLNLFYLINKINDRQYPYKIDNYTVEAENYTDFVEFCQSIYWKGRRSRKWRTKVTYES